MKFLKIFIITVLVISFIFIVAFILLNDGYGPSQEQKRFIKEKKALIDPAKCGPNNCEACDSTQCSNYVDSCQYAGFKYACGASCDSAFLYCISKK